MRPSPLASTSSFTSSTIVSNPAAAETCAIPPPINPHPNTPTVLIAIAPSPVRSLKLRPTTLGRHFSAACGP